IMGETESQAVKELGLCWSAFRSSWFQFSYNIPGTTVYRFVKARRKAAKLLTALILKKKASKEGLGDFLDIIFDEMEKDGAALDIDRAVNLIFTFFILSQETTPGVLGAVVKLVADHPSVMEELQVIKESLRFTSTQPTVHRIHAQDVQIGDYTLPAGWLFFGIPQVHFDGEKYGDPLTFNPWRWSLDPKTRVLRRYTLTFPAGCVVHISKDSE
ncbi:Cytochrome P450, partial [Arabidopsis thaliana x Arabidopsis arenosa]